MPKWFKGLVGIVLLCLVLGLFGIFFSENMLEVIDGQLTKLRENRVTQAYYDYTSKEFQKITSMEAFRKFITLYPVLSDNKSFIFEGRGFDNDIGRVQGTLISNDLQEMQVEYHLIKEDYNWKILSIRLKELLQDEEGSVTSQLINIVDGQLKAFRKKDIVDAYYAFISKDFQKETPFSAFEEYVKTHPILMNYKGVNFKDRRIKNDKGYVNLVLSSDNGDYILEYALTKEAGDWKIWSLKIVLPPEEAAKKVATNPEALVPPVRKLLDTLLLDNAQDAYNTTAKEFQEATSYEAFEVFISNYPVLIQRNLADIRSGSIENGVGKLRVNLHDAEGMTVIEFKLGFEDGQWTIWGMRVIEHPEASQNDSIAPLQEETPSLFEIITEIIQNQLLELRHQDFHNVYSQYTSSFYRNKNSFSDFEKYILDHPEFTLSRSTEFNRLLSNENHATVLGTLTSFDYQNSPMRYELVRENGSWKIDQFVSLSDEEALAESEALLNKQKDDFPQKPLEFSKIVIGTDTNDKGLIESSQTTIDPSFNLIHVNVYINNGTADTLIKLLLEHAGSASTTPLLSTTLEKDGNTVVAFCYAAPAHGWPEGDYLVKVTSSSGQETIQREFWIKK